MKIILQLRYLLLVLVIHFTSTSHAQILLSAPQKIVIDAKRNRLLVSNENTGSIVQIDSVGNQSYFIQAAGFVDGMEIVGDTIYGVANNRKIKAYNLVTKQLVMNVTFPGAATNYLSSIASDSAGHLFVSCPFLNEVYKLRISDEAVWVFAKDNGLNKPNGILLEREKNRILVIDDSPVTSILHAISLTDSVVSTLATFSLNSPDGIVRDKLGYYYIGGYYLNGVYRTDENFSQPPELFHSGTHMVYPTYDISDNSILITHYGTNNWERIPLTYTGEATVNQPTAYEVYPITPNPVREQATIKFVLNRSTHIRLEVFDISGALVQTLLNEERKGGEYSLVWNGKNALGIQVANGLYYFRITGDGGITTQKALLIR